MKITKKDLILNYLKENGSITSLESFEKFRATRLSAIIYDLVHRDGYDIETKIEHSNGTHYGRYIYHGLKKEQPKKEMVKPVIEEHIIKQRDNDEMIYNKENGTTYLW